MLNPVYTTQFKRDLKRIQQRGYDTTLLKEVLLKLYQEETLDEEYKDHPLKQNWHGYRELHIKSDWLLVYKILGDDCILTRTGTHSVTIQVGENFLKKNWAILKKCPRQKT